jgi:hypothetical protein
LIREVTAIDIAPGWADTLAIGTLALVAVLSGVLNVRDVRRDRN